MVSIGEIFEKVGGKVGEFLDITDVARVFMGEERVEEVNEKIARRLEEEPQEWGPVERALYEGGADIGIMPMTGMFVRPSATKLAKVKELLEAGTSPRDIRGKTGVFKSPYDKKLREEISDVSAKIKMSYPDIARIGDIPLPLDAVFEHDELFKRYPELRNTTVRFDPDIKHSSAKYLEDSNTIKIGVEGGIPSRKDLKELFIHEIQHGIQGFEDWARGGSPTEVPEAFKELFESELDKLFNKAKKTNMHFSEEAFKQRAAKNIYRKFAGEIESRAAAKRSNLSIQEILDFEPMFEGIKADEAIVRFR